MRSSHIAVIIIILISLTVGTLGAINLLLETPEQNTTSKDRLEIFTDNIRSGGVPPDGIPPIENPQYWNVTQADDFLADRDIIFGFIHNGIPKAYPQRILVWHEIVNEDGGISITYCPLTGSVVGYHGNLGTDDIKSNFGTSGKLLNSNLVMYDRSTNSYWPQILGQAITGDKLGSRLESEQVYWTTWAAWKLKYNETLVLSTDTGVFRDYTIDPYGSYSQIASYYFVGGPLFNVMDSDDRLQDKEVVIGIDYKNEQISVQKTLLKDKKVINLDLENNNLVVFYDEELDVARVYSRVINNEVLNFSYIDGNIMDNQGMIWTIEGFDDNNVNSLEKVVYFDVMWFAWFAFFPEADLIMI